MSDQPPSDDRPSQPPTAPPHWSAPGGPPLTGPPQGAPYPPYQPPPFVRPEAPSATTALVLGIVGLAGGFTLCGIPLIVSPFAWYFGNQALREIEESGRTLGGESQAKAGQIMGIIGSVLLGLAVAGILIALIVAATTSS